MNQQHITVSVENSPYIAPLSDNAAKAFYSVLLEKIKELSKSEKATAA